MKKFVDPTCFLREKIFSHPQESTKSNRRTLKKHQKIPRIFNKTSMYDLTPKIVCLISKDCSQILQRLKINRVKSKS